MFDIVKALSEAGLPNSQRPEHVDKSAYAGATKSGKKFAAKGRPWILEKTTDVLHNFAPVSSKRFHLDPSKAQAIAKRNRSETDSII